MYTATAVPLSVRNSCWLSSSVFTQLRELARPPSRSLLSARVMMTCLSRIYGRREAVSTRSVLRTPSVLICMLYVTGDHGVLTVQVGDEVVFGNDEQVYDLDGIVQQGPGQL